METTTLLFYEPLNAKTYLHQLLAYYPYDIDPSLVDTLLTSQPYAHPSLLTFIDFVRHSRTYLIITNDPHKSDLSQLFMMMCTLSQRNTTVLHTHQFYFDCTFHITHYPIFHPYSFLPFDQVAFVDNVLIHQTKPLYFSSQSQALPIQYTATFPFQDISFDPNTYFALSITITNYHDLIFIPRQLAPLIVALSTLYVICTPVSHPDFILCYGIGMPNDENVIAYDQSNQLYIGCCRKTTQHSCSLVECRKMLEALYCAITLQKQDLTISGAMLTIQLKKQAYGILLCGKQHWYVSAFIDALLKTCDQENITYTKVFENYGTLHLLDNAIYANGAQIGACIPIQAFDEKRIFEHLSATIPVKAKQSLVALLTPFTTPDITCHFHHVNIICYVDEMQSETGRFSTPAEALPYLSEQLCFEALNHTETMQSLWETYLNTMFLNELPIYHFAFKHDQAKNNQKCFSHQLLALINTCVNQTE